MQAIQEIAEGMPTVNDDQVLGELADYRSKENFFAKPFVWKSVQKTTPTSWWNGICCSTQLSQVASNILSLPPTSAAVERSFSRHAFIHSAKRNRLTTDRAAKLVFIGHNLALGNVDEAIAEQSLKEAQAKAPLQDLSQPSTSRVSSAASCSFPPYQLESATESESDVSIDVSLHDNSSDAEESDLWLCDLSAVS